MEIFHKKIYNGKITCEKICPISFGYCNSLINLNIKRNVSVLCRFHYQGGLMQCLSFTRLSPGLFYHPYIASACMSVNYTRKIFLLVYSIGIIFFWIFMTIHQFLPIAFHLIVNYNWVFIYNFFDILPTPSQIHELFFLIFLNNNYYAHICWGSEGLQQFFFQAQILSQLCHVITETCRHELQLRSNVLLSKTEQKGSRM